MRQYWRYSLIPILFLVVIPVILAILLYPLLAQSQDMKSFTFHTDATVGNGDEVDITGLTLVGVTITGSTTSNRAVTFEVADSIGTYSAVKCVDIDTLVVFEGVTLSGVAPHRFQCPVGGFKKFRVRISGGTTGTINAVGLGLSKAFRGITPSSGNTGGGSSIVLDLGDNGSNESIALSEIATLGDTFGIFSESSPDKLLVDVDRKSVV